VDGTGSVSCPVAGLVISSVELPGSATTVLAVTTHTEQTQQPFIRTAASPLHILETKLTNLLHGTEYFPKI
jgi:hypothetical protein